MACRVPLNTLEPGLPGLPEPIVQNSTDISVSLPIYATKIKKPRETPELCRALFCSEVLGQKKSAFGTFSENASP
jgi:hypothetical protein